MKIHILLEVVIVVLVMNAWNCFSAAVETPMVQDLDANDYSITNVDEISAGVILAEDAVFKNPWVDVRAFGAKGDNVTDDTTAIQNAIDSGAAGIFIPEGKFKVSGITLRANQTLFGLGMKSQIKLLAGYPAGNILTIGGDNTVIRDVYIFNLFADNLIPTGRAINIVGYKNCKIMNVFATAGTAVFLSNTSGIEMINVHLEQCFDGYGLRLYGEGGAVKNCSFTNVVLYYNFIGMRMTGDVSSVSFNNTVALHNIEHGFWLDDGGKCNKLIGCIAFSNRKHGFYIRNASYNIFKACIARDNSNYDGYEGVYGGFAIVGSSSINNIIQKCVSIDSRGSLISTQGYGVYIEAPASQNTIIDNILYPNKTASLYECGTTNSNLAHNFTNGTTEKHSGFYLEGYASLLSTNGNTGSFTLTANASTNVNNTSITVDSKIIFFPANTGAANLVKDSKSPYIAAVTPGQGFTISTADGTAAYGTEVFNYLVFN